MAEAYLDANVLLRFLTKNPPAMAEKARAILAAASEGQVRLVLLPVVLAEVVWTLSSFYSYDRAQIGDGLIPLLTVKGLEVKDKDAQAMALSLYRDHNIDFVDAMVAAYALVEVPQRVCTFDHDFRRIPGLEILTPGEKEA